MSDWRCEEHGEGNMVGGICSLCSDTTPSPHERSVLEAAEAWYEASKPFASLTDEAIALIVSIKALRASRPPAAKRPEEVETGTRFRFSASKVAQFEHRTLRCVSIYNPESNERTPAWLIEETGLVSLFHADDRIIPLD